MFVWSTEAEEAFQHLKKVLITAPVLAFSQFEKPFEIETDASDFSIGAVLIQEGRPLAFLRKALGPKNHGLSTYEKECMAILMAADRWRSYIQETEFIICTDQSALSHLGIRGLSHRGRGGLIPSLWNCNIRCCIARALKTRSLMRYLVES